MNFYWWGRANADVFTEQTTDNEDLETCSESTGVQDIWLADASHGRTDSPIVAIVNAPFAPKIFGLGQPRAGQVFKDRRRSRSHKRFHVGNPKDHDCVSPFLESARERGDWIDGASPGKANAPIILAMLNPTFRWKESRFLYASVICLDCFD